jgi:hypothetical protein
MNIYMNGERNILAMLSIFDIVHNPLKEIFIVLSDNQ